MAPRRTQRSQAQQNVENITNGIHKIVDSVAQVATLSKDQDARTIQIIAVGFGEIVHHLRTAELNLQFPGESQLNEQLKNAMRDGIRSIRLELDADPSLRTLDALKLVRITRKLIEQAAVLNMATSGLKLDDHEPIVKILSQAAQHVGLQKARIREFEIRVSIRT